MQILPNYERRDTKFSSGKMSSDFDGDVRGSDAGSETQGDHFALPNALTRLRACLSCKIVLATQQFIREGCPNCTGDYVGDRQAVEQLTTRNFSGTAALIDPARSWVGRNIKVETFVPGVYAIAVQGAYAGEELDEYEQE
jgi:transcription elongation factor SPT4